MSLLMGIIILLLFVAMVMEDLSDSTTLPSISLILITSPTFTLSLEYIEARKFATTSFEAKPYPRENANTAPAMIIEIF